MPARSRAVEAAENLIETSNVTAAPVKVRELARKHAFVMGEPLPDDVSGMLVPTDEGSTKKWIIVYNKRHSLERQRFTIAHELAHLLLHQFKTPHADGRQSVKFRDGLSSQGTDPEEIEANQFAASLLMPAAILVPQLEEAGFDAWDADGEASKTIERMARDFQVSQRALVLRIANLLNSA